MNRARYVELSVVAAICISSFSGAYAQNKGGRNSKPTLESLQKLYVGRTVALQQVSRDWHGADQIFEHIIGTIVSVTRESTDTSGVRSWARTATGETKLVVTFVDPDVDVTVRFSDGREAVAHGPGRLFCCTRDPIQSRYDYFRFTTPREAHAPIIRANLKSVIGKSLYALSNSELFQPDIPRDLLLRRWGPTILDLKEMGYLRPLKIVTAEYDESSDSVILGLQLPNGGAAYAVSSYIEEGMAPFLRKIQGTLYASIPPTFSQLDIRALRTNSLLIGMSEDALLELYGAADNENNWGRGGRQLIYDKGRLLTPRRT